MKKLIEKLLAMFCRKVEIKAEIQPNDEFLEIVKKEYNLEGKL